VLSVSVVPVGLTRHHKYGHRPLTSGEMESIIAQVEAWQGEFQRSLGVRFSHLTDEWYLATGRPVPPTYRQFAALVRIAEAGGRVVTYEDLGRALWDAPASSATKRRIAVIMCRLRSQLGETASYIDTVRPVGYRLAPFATSRPGDP